MSLLNARGVGIQTVAICLLLTVPGASQQGGSHPLFRRSVPDSVMAAAARPRSPESFARVLASLHVPAGIVLEKDDVSSPDAPLDPYATVGSWTLGDAVEAFRRGRPDYLVDADETGVFLAPKSSGCIPPTARLVDVAQGGGPLYVVIWQIAKAVDPATPRVPPGMVGGGGGQDEPGERDVFREHVTLPGGSASLRATLMDLSRQVPGVVWALRETPGKDGVPSVCTLTLLASRRTLTTSYRAQ